MNSGDWNKFVTTRERFRLVTEELAHSLPKLKDIQQKLADSRSETSYTVETPVVYNSALDSITVNDEIKLILVADNPGRREQAAENKRYLAGPSGKIARNFFLNNPALGIDFLKNVIILNKTPIHSPRTNELRRLVQLEESSKGTASRLKQHMEESQKKMAQLLLEFHEALNVPVFIIGYSEMKKGGIFEIYTERLKELYADKPKLYKQLFFFRHFSMNQFTIDLKKQSLPKETTAQTLKRIGTLYRERILNR